MNYVEKRPGTKLIGVIPEWAGKVVQMQIYQDRLLVACEFCVFEVRGDQLSPLEFKS